MLGWALAPSHHIYGWERDEEAYFVNGSVVRQEVFQSLGVEVVVGGVPGHVVVVAIPRRQVEGGSHALLPHSLDELSDDVSLSALPVGGGHAVGRVGVGEHARP